MSIWRVHLPFLPISTTSYITVSAKTKNANKDLDAIKYTLHNAPGKQSYLLNASLCRSVLKYTDILPDLTESQTSDAIEILQIRAMKEVKRRRYVTEAVTALSVQCFKE